MFMNTATIIILILITHISGLSIHLATPSENSLKIEAVNEMRSSFDEKYLANEYMTPPSNLNLNVETQIGEPHSFSENYPTNTLEVDKYNVW
jgi:hypothetical protein